MRIEGNAPGTVAVRLGNFGLVLPPGFALTTLAERPDLEPDADAHHAGMRPATEP